MPTPAPVEPCHAAVGTLTNGSKFDSSRDRGEGFTFRLGAGMVIKGWDQGVAGMKVGGLRKLTIPPHLGGADPEGDADGVDVKASVDETGTVKITD